MGSPFVAPRLYTNMKVQLFVAALIAGNFLCNIIEKWIDPAGTECKTQGIFRPWVSHGYPMSDPLDPFHEFSIVHDRKSWCVLTMLRGSVRIC